MTRYEPARAGVINMWDYRDEEFSFAGGWLVLRGPNGSGKTKALEVLFPFVLDGRIDTKRLNPFAAEDRTMKSNLLYRGMDNAVGYVWLEFRHRDTGDAVTVGIGLHAQRHRDTPVRWHFVGQLQRITRGRALVEHRGDEIGQPGLVGRVGVAPRPDHQAGRNDRQPSALVENQRQPVRQRGGRGRGELKWPGRTCLGSFIAPGLVSVDRLAFSFRCCRRCA